MRQVRCAMGMAAVLVAACGLEEPVIVVPVDGAKAAVVVFEGTAGVEGVALDLSERTGAYLTVSRERAAERAVYALAYDCSLAALGIAAGPVSFGAGGAALEPPRAVYRDGAIVEGWPEVLARLRVVGGADFECRAIDEERYVVAAESSSDEVRFVVALDEARGLFATAGGAFSLVTAGRRERLTEVSTTTPNLGAVVVESGELWLAGRGGRIAAGDVMLGFEMKTARTSTRGRTRIWLDGRADDLFLVSDELSFEHFDGTAWTVLYEGTGELNRSRAGVARVGDGEAIAVGVAGANILRRRSDGSLRMEQLPGGAIPISVARTSAFGVLVGGDPGGLFRDTATGWVALEVGGQNAVRAIAELDESALFGGEEGVMSRYLLSGRVCAPSSVAAGDVNVISSRGSSVFALSNIVGGDDVISELHVAPRACGGDR